MDTVVWIATHGSTKIVIATTSSFNNFYVNHRLALIDYYHNAQSFLVMKSAQTVEEAQSILTECKGFGSIQNIFITSSESFDYNAAKNFDKALSSVDPSVPIICLLGNNPEKSVSRIDTRPVFNVRWESGCGFIDVLKAMDKILSNKYYDVEVKGDRALVMKEAKSSGKIYFNLFCL